MSETRRYILTLRKVPRAARDKFRALSRAETYREIKPGEVGEHVLYSVELDEREYQQALRDVEDPQSNLLAIEENQVGRPAAVPDREPLRYMAAERLPSLGLTGKGVDVGLVDAGLSRVVADTVFAGRIKAARSEQKTTDLTTGEVTRSDPFIDPNGHGTLMAGMAVPTQAKLVFGAAPEYVLDHVISALYWMVDEIGVDVVNLSIGGYGHSQALCDAVWSAVSKGVLVFAAAGNDGVDKKDYPAGCSGALPVSNYDWRTDAIAKSSNYGAYLFAAAPGMAIVSYARDGSEQYLEDGGTSSATAHASRIAASLIQNPAGAAKRDPDMVRRYLAKTARKTGAGPLYEGNGVLQLAAAANAIRKERPECPPGTVPATTTTYDIRFVMDESGSVTQVK